MPPSLLSTATVKDLMRSPYRKWRVYHNHQEVSAGGVIAPRFSSDVAFKECPSPGDVAADANRSERTLEGKLVLTRPLRDEKHARPHTGLPTWWDHDRDSETSVGRVVLKIAQQSRMTFQIPLTVTGHFESPITLVAHDFLVLKNFTAFKGGYSILLWASSASTATEMALFTVISISRITYCSRTRERVWSSLIAIRQSLRRIPDRTK
ncbi:hypothetical protein CPB85DRAFT_1257709 [Mucidula mucida]|nr:hypothetical protein CPB85DRAFT_1257709 [Mucidula mucida]